MLSVFLQADLPLSIDLDYAGIIAHHLGVQVDRRAARLIGQLVGSALHLQLYLLTPGNCEAVYTMARSICT